MTNEAEQLYALAYLSSCTSPMNDEELESLLVRAKTNNAARKVSGILIYNNGNFISTLKGLKVRFKSCLVRSKATHDMRV